MAKKCSITLKSGKNLNNSLIQNTITSLNNKGVINIEEIKKANFDNGIKNVRDFGLYLVAINEEMKNSQKEGFFPLYEDTNEIKIEYLLDYIQKKIGKSKSKNKDVQLKVIESISKSIPNNTSKKLDNTVKYEFAYDSKQSSKINNIMLDIYLDLLRDRSNFKIFRTRGRLKVELLNEFNRRVNEVRDSYISSKNSLNNHQEEYWQSFQNAWKNGNAFTTFLDFLNKNIGHNFLRNTKAIQEELDKFNEEGEDWEFDNAFKINRFNSLHTIVKEKLLKVFKDFNIFQDNPDRRTCYLPETINLQRLYNVLINVHRNDTTQEDFRKTIRVISSLINQREFLKFNDSNNISILDFSLAMQEIETIFNSSKETDIEFQNAYIAGLKLASLKSDNFWINNKNQIKQLTSNTGSFAENYYYDTSIAFLRQKFRDFNKSKYKKGEQNPLAELTSKNVRQSFFKIDIILDAIRQKRDVEVIMLMLSDALIDLGIKTSPVAIYLYYNIDTNQNLSHIVGLLQELKKRFELVEEKGKGGIITYNEEKFFEDSIVIRDLLSLSEIAALDFTAQFDNSYTSSNGSMYFTPQQDSFISKMFRGIIVGNSVNKKKLYVNFGKYLDALPIVNDYVDNNFLIYDKETGIGIFDKTENWKDRSLPLEQRFTVNQTFINKCVGIRTRANYQDNDVHVINRYGAYFQVRNWEGIQWQDGSVSEYKKELYVEAKKSRLINAVFGNYMFNTSDTPRTQILQLDKMPISVGEWSAGGVLIRKNSKGEFIIDKKYGIYKAIIKIVKKDLNTFMEAGKTLFAKGFDTKTLPKYQNIKYHNGKAILDNTGKPTGKAFQFLNLSYILNGKYNNFVTHLATFYNKTEQQIYADLITISQNKKGKSIKSFEEIEIEIESFVNEYLKNEYENSLEQFEEVLPLIHTFKNEKQGRVNVDTLTHVAYHDQIYMALQIAHNEERVAFERYDRDNLPTKEKIEANRAALDTALRNPNHPINQEAFRYQVLQAKLNYLVLNEAFNDIINSNITEYKSMLEINKRNGQIEKIGSPVIADGDFANVLIIDNLNVESNTLTEDLALPISDILKAKLKQMNTANDGISYITDTYMELILKKTGRWNVYKAQFEALRGLNKEGKEVPTTFNPTDYSTLQQQMKFFITFREQGDSVVTQDIDDFFRGDARTIQIKDSTIVLFETTAAGQGLSEVYQFMKDNGISQISPSANLKVGGVLPYQFHQTSNGVFEGINPNGNHTNSLIRVPVSSYIIQQDIPTNIMDNRVIVGNQLLRHIVSSLIGTPEIKYTLDGKEYSGEEIFEKFNRILVENIYEDYRNFIADLTTQTNYYDSKGNIVINPERLVNILKRSAIEDIDSTLLDMLEKDSEGNYIVPLSFNQIYGKLESIIFNQIFKKINRLELNGFHVPITPEVYTKTQFEWDYKGKKQNIKDNGSIIFRNEWIEERRANAKDGKINLSLKSAYWKNNGQDYYEAEIITSPHMKEFFETIGIEREINGKTVISVDINKIEPEALHMIGFRIPTDSKSSIVNLKVVGFFADGRSTIMLPSSLINQTGWDFDIDSLYVFAKNLEYVKKGKYNYQAIKYNEKDNVLQEDKIKTVVEFFKEDLSPEQIKVGNSKINISVNIIRNAFTPIVEATKNFTDGRVFIDLIKRNLNEKLKNTSSISEADIKLIKALSKNIPSITTLMTKVFLATGKIATGIKEYNDSLEKSSNEEYLLNDTVEQNIKEFRNFYHRFLNVYDTFKKNLVSLQSGDNAIILSEENGGQIDLNHPVLKMIDKTVNDFQSTYDNMQPINSYRQARENHFIDIIASILSNSQIAEETKYINDTNKMVEAAAIINEAMGFNKDLLNINNFNDAINLSNMAMNSVNLKGYAVNFINMVLLHGTIPFSTPKISKKFNGKIVSNNSYVGDLKKTTEFGQVYQFVPATLDAIKNDYQFALNEFSLEIFTLLSTFAQVEETANAKNIYLYPSAFISQKIIMKLANEYYSNGGYMTAKSMKKVKKEYVDKLLALYKKAGGKNKEILSEVKFTNKQFEEIIKTIGEENTYDITKITDKYYSFDELLSLIRQPNEQSAHYLIAQLKVLDAYLEYRPVADLIKRNMFATRFDKNRRNFIDLDNSIRQVEECVVNYQEFKHELSKGFRESQTTVKGLKNENIMADFKVMSTAQFNLKHKSDIKMTYRDFIDALHEFKTARELRTKIEIRQRYYEPKSTTHLTHNGKTLIENIIGFEFAGNVPTIDEIMKGSANPLLAARYYYAQKLLQNAFGEMFLQRNPNVIMLTDEFLENNNKFVSAKTKKAFREVFVNGLLNYNDDTIMPLLYNNSQEDISRIIDSNTNFEKQKNDTNTAKEIAKNLTIDNYNEYIEDFVKLPFRHKLFVIQENSMLQYYVTNNIFHSNHIFQLLEYNERISRNQGFSRVLFNIVDDIRGEAVIRSIKDAWTSDNFFIADTIRDFIAFSYYAHGFRNGYNGVKYIPIELFREVVPNQTYADLSIQYNVKNVTTGLENYFSKLIEIQNYFNNAEAMEMNGLFEYVLRQNPNYLPDVTKIDNFGRVSVEVNGKISEVNPLMIRRVKDKNATNDKYYQTVENIYIETSDRLLAKGRETVTFGKIGYKADNLVKAYQSTTIPNLVVYIPMGKLMKGEFTELSLSERYNKDMSQGFEVIRYEKGKESAIVEEAFDSVEQFIQTSKYVKEFIKLDKINAIAIESFEEEFQTYNTGLEENENIADIDSDFEEYNDVEFSVDFTDIENDDTINSEHEDRLDDSEDIGEISLEDYLESTTTVPKIDINYDSVMDAIYGLTKDTDFNLYISDKGFTTLEQKILVNTGVIYIDYTKSPIEEGRRIAALVKNKIFISGDETLTSKLNKNDLYQWIRIFTQELESHTNLTGINVLSNNHIGTLIAHSFSDRTNITNGAVKETNDNLQIYFSVTPKIERLEETSNEYKLFKVNEVLKSSIDNIITIKKIFNGVVINNKTYNIVKSLYSYIKNLNKDSFTDEILTNTVLQSIEKCLFLVSNINTLINSIYQEIKTVNITNIYNNHNNLYDFKKKLQQIVFLSKFVQIYNELSVLENPNESIEIDTINDYIKGLLRYNQLNSEIVQNVKIKIEELFIHHLINDSANPKFTTIYKKILELHKANSNVDWADENIVKSLNISKEEYNQIRSTLFSFKHQDIDFLSRWLDSSYQTGVPFIDLTGKQFNKIQTANNIKVNENNIALEKALEEYSEEAAKQDNKGKQIREELLKSLVDDYGNLISEYDINNTYVDLNTMLYKHNNMINNLFYNALSHDEKSMKLIVNLQREFLNDFKNNERELVRMTDEEIEELDNVLLNYTNDEKIGYYYQNKIVGINQIETITNEKPQVIYYRLVFKQKNAIYAELERTNPKKIEFLKALKDIIYRTIGDYNKNFRLNRNTDCILPYIKIAEKSLSLTIPQTHEEDSYIDIMGNKKYVYKAKTLEIPRKYSIFKPRFKQKFDSKEEYLNKLEEEWNNFKKSNREIYDKEFNIKNENDVIVYNNKVELENAKFSKETRSYNIIEIIDKFSREIYDIKTLRDFESDWSLSNYLLVENNVQELIPNAFSQSKRQIITNFDTNKVESSTDKIAKLIGRYTSMNYMWFNLTAGIKNIMKGVTDMITYSPIVSSTRAGKIVGRSDLTKSISEVARLIPTWIKELNWHASSTFEGALIKDFANIYQDTKEFNVSTDGSTALTKVLMSIDKYGYLPNSAGEFIMQYGMLIAMINSHRVINGQIISLRDYIGNTSEQELLQVLDEKQTNEYRTFKYNRLRNLHERRNKSTKTVNNQSDIIDTAGEFIRRGVLTKEQLKQLKSIQKTYVKSMTERFNKLPSLREQLELKEGHIAIKEESSININDLNNFKQRVKATNQSLHGVYNQIDRNQVQDKEFRNLFMQFRKWMRPTYIRFFGRRFNQITYNESLRTFETPIFRPFFNFWKQGYDLFRQDNPNAKLGFNGLEGIRNLGIMLRMTLSQLTNIGAYYTSLNIYEKMAAIQFCNYIVATSTAILTYVALAGLKDRDDDDDFTNTWAYNLLLYEISNYRKEMSNIFPVFGWKAEVDNFLRTPFAGSNIVKNTISLTKRTLNLIAPLDDTVYRSGMYKGQNKWTVSFQKAVPVYGQIKRLVNIESATSFNNYMNGLFW